MMNVPTSKCAYFVMVILYLYMDAHIYTHICEEFQEFLKSIH